MVWVYSGLWFLLGLIFSLESIKKIIIVARSRTMNISELSTEGFVKVGGKAAGKTLMSPVTHSPCVLWRIEIQDGSRRGTSSTDNWTTIHRQWSEEPVEINDGTGTVQVSPDSKAVINLPRGDPHKFDSQTLAEAKKFGIQITLPKRLYAFQKLRAFQQCVFVDDQIFVFGYAQQENGVKIIARYKGTSPIISNKNDTDILTELFLRVGLIFLAVVFAEAILPVIFK